MPDLIINNVATKIMGQLAPGDGTLNDQYHNALRKELSYDVPNAKWSDKFKTGIWDGKISLYKRSDMSFPTGLVGKVVSLFKTLNIPFRLIDTRVKPKPNILLRSIFEEYGREARFYQDEAVELSYDKTRGVIVIATGGGKCLDINTPVRSLAGWTTMGELYDGCPVFGKDGKSIEVTKAHPIIYNKPCYEISFSNGETIVTCDEHIWTVRINPSWNRLMPTKNLSTLEMYQVMYEGKKLLVGKHIKKTQRQNPVKRASFFIESCEPLDFGQDKILPINPYVLGCWLGDGGKDGGHFTNVDNQITDGLVELGLDMSRGKYDGYKEWNVRGLRTKLKELNLFKNKHIPDIYLNSSFNQRLELLHGLMDTDGTVALDGGSELSLSDEILANDALELIRSLGIQATINQNESWLKNKRHKDRFRIKFATSQDVCRLIRKKERLKFCKDRPTSSRIYIKSIKPVETRPVRCVTVDSDDNLYLVGKTLVPTHNTYTACNFLVKASVVPFIFIVPSVSLLRQTHSEFRKYLRVGDDIPHIGFLGDGVFDISPQGINVITYQTAFAAFDLAFDEKTGRVKVDPLTGEKIRKPTKQLEDELLAARKVFRDEYKKSYDAWDKPPRGMEYRKYMSRCMKKYRKALYAAKTAVIGRKKSLAQKMQIRDLFLNAKGFIDDEAHVAAETIEELGKRLPNAYYRIGQTATPWTEKNDQIRIEGTFGRQLINISPSDLVHLGYSVPVNALGLKIVADETEDGKDSFPKKTYPEKYKSFIMDNWERNWRIKQAAEELQAMGIPTLIFVEKIDHGNILEDMIENSVFVPGGDQGDNDVTSAERDYRRRMLNACERNEIILIATQWVNTGIDAPRLGALVFAGSPQVAGQIIQMLGRGSRCVGKDFAESKKNGKSELIAIYFVDTQSDMHSHSLSFERIVRSEEAWKIRRVKT